MSAKYTFAVYETIVGSAVQKLILLKLADNANDDGVSWPGMEYLAKHCELSKSAIIRNLKALEEKGFVQVERRKSDDGKKNLSNVYKLTLGSSSQPLPPSSSELPPSSSQPLPPSSSELPESNNNKPNKEPSMSSTDDLAESAHVMTSSEIVSSEGEGEVKKTSIQPDLLSKISEAWNDKMEGFAPSVDLSKNTQVNKKRLAAIKRIMKDYPDYSDYEYWQGHIAMLATIPQLQWQRENQKITFDQCLQAEKFERNLGFMKMEVGR